jgi:hypothetical protein
MVWAPTLIPNAGPEPTAKDVVAQQSNMIAEHIPVPQRLAGKTRSMEKLLIGFRPGFCPHLLVDFICAISSNSFNNYNHVKDYKLM